MVSESSQKDEQKGTEPPVATDQTTDDTYYITLPGNIPAAADVEAQVARQAAEQAEQLRIERNLCEILSIPFAYCPWPAVRNALIERVLGGAYIKVYSWYSASVWKLEDHTYPGQSRVESPREWAVRNGYAVDGEAR